MDKQQDVPQLQALPLYPDNSCAENTLPPPDDYLPFDELIAIQSEYEDECKVSPYNLSTSIGKASIEGKRRHDDNRGNVQKSALSWDLGWNPPADLLTLKRTPIVKIKNNDMLSNEDSDEENEDSDEEGDETRNRSDVYDEQEEEDGGDYITSHYDNDDDTFDQMGGNDSDDNTLD
eukprot:m.10170 g.10170  ORF g.10170 m.10170 type:complete len:176 (-) comp3625_c0_seq1:202-729(-)